jgi:Flp pilus assembly pilin Flp
MNHKRAWLSRWLARVEGGEALEYVLVFGLILLTAAAVVGTIGTEVLADWRPAVLP